MGLDEGYSKRVVTKWGWKLPEPWTNEVLSAAWIVVRSGLGLTLRIGNGALKVGLRKQI